MFIIDTEEKTGTRFVRFYYDTKEYEKRSSFVVENESESGGRNINLTKQ